MLTSIEIVSGLLSADDVFGDASAFSASGDVVQSSEFGSHKFDATILERIFDGFCVGDEFVSFDGIDAVSFGQAGESFFDPVIVAG